MLVKKIFYFFDGMMVDAFSAPTLVPKISDMSRISFPGNISG